MSTAALVAGWGRSQWRGGFAAPANIPGPMSPAGSFPAQGPNDPIGLTVELYLGALGWTDISPYTYYRDGSTKIQVTRGRPNEASRVQPQTASLQLNNRDGRFSPRNPNGAYYGVINRNTPIRISRMWNGVRKYRYVGEVPSWPVTWDQSGNDVWVPLSAAGQLRRFQQGARPLGSVLRRTIPLTPSLVAYWPCEDGTNATSFAAAVANTPMGIAGTPNPASFSGFFVSDPIPTLGTDSWIATVPGYMDVGSGRIRIIIHTPLSTVADGSRIMAIETGGTISRIDIIYRTAGSLQLKAYDTNNVLVQDSGSLSGLGGIDNGQSRITVNWDPHAGGGSTDLSFGYLNSVQGFSVNLGTYALSQSVAGVKRVRIAPDGTMGGASIGHLYVESTSTDPYQSLFWINAALGEVPGTRFARLCAEQGINGVVSSGGEVGTDQTGMGYQLSDTFPNLIQQAADTGLGLLYEATDQLALVYRTRLSLYNQGTSYNSSRPGLTLDYAQHQLNGPLDPLDDDAYTRNDVTAARISGSSAQAVDSSALDPLSTVNVGDYQTTYSLSVGYDAQLPDHAHWRLHMGTVNEPRYPTIRLNLRHPQFTGNVDLMNQVLGLDIGDLVVIKNPPAGRGAVDDIRLIVQGYTETLGIFEHEMVLNCSPEAPYRVGMFDDPVLGRYDTDGSALALAYPLGTETSLQVASTNTLLPLWTTSGGAFPFDIAVGGERMTVTNITGGASPQTFTVTRSVNGVVKSQTQGTDVRLWQPTIVSL